jgi:L,D-transpeptidase ErfK/SrfK
MIKRFLLILFISSASSSYAQDIENFTTYTDYNIQKGESLYKIAQNFDLGLDEILRANPNITNPRVIYAGQKIILPTTHLLPEANHEGIVINLAEPRLYFFLDDQEFSFPISIGADEKTPTGKTKILDKRENPTWTPPASIREENPNLPEVVPAGPDNPLGNYAVHLDASHNYKWQGIMIHGTNAPWTIGSKVSHGCIRLYPQDIEKLFGNIEVETPVEIVNQPIKVSEVNDKIYIEVHLQETPDVVLESMGVGKLICKKIKECESRIDWQKVDDAVIAGLGIPAQINRD